MSSTAVSKQSIPGIECLDGFDFSAYLYEESISFIHGDTWHGNLQSPVPLKDSLLPPLNQHDSAGATFSSDSVLLTPAGQILIPGQNPAATEFPQNIPAVQPLGQTIDSDINGISMKNNLTKFAYLEEEKSGRPRRAKKACDRCRKMKIRCIQKGEGDCVPRSRVRKLASRKGAQHPIQGSAAISLSFEPQAIQFELPDLLAAYQKIPTI